MTDRSRDVSIALTEVRTVHSRALSALDRLDGGWSGDHFFDPDYPSWEDSKDLGLAYHEWHYWRPSFYMADPDIEEMIEALEKVDELLVRWAKRHRKSRR